jgi:hypothetical protein
LFGVHDGFQGLTSSGSLWRLLCEDK